MITIQIFLYMYEVINTILKDWIGLDERSNID